MEGKGNYIIIISQPVGLTCKVIESGEGGVTILSKPFLMMGFSRFRGLQKSVNHDGMGDNMVRALKHVGRAASLQEVFRVSARTSLSSLT